MAPPPAARSGGFARAHSPLFPLYSPLAGLLADFGPTSSSSRSCPHVGWPSHALVATNRRAHIYSCVRDRPPVPNAPAADHAN
ncbi:hypothetical protein B0H16DRAFT_1736155 [Mycena metata]|uniref:Uncharacterized protein n=1 Tax=Mycena metata TaxID=1033252 RepID=A0AAD7HAS4_9AGAR|nr:hypothetical protein B0H16DRAFT_1741427 [Mycena metata]KAJ7725493.1 hypothetical protein B0H16DRAFT_1736155 [Mycena metata]